MSTSQIYLLKIVFMTLVAFQYIHLSILHSWITLFNVPSALSKDASTAEHLYASFAVMQAHDNQKSSEVISTSPLLKDGIHHLINKLWSPPHFTTFLQYPVLTNTIQKLFYTKKIIYDLEVCANMASLAQKPFIFSVSYSPFVNVKFWAEWFLEIAYSVFNNIEHQDQLIKMLTPGKQVIMQQLLNKAVTSGSSLHKVQGSATLGVLEVASSSLISNGFTEDAIKHIGDIVYKVEKKLSINDFVSIL